MNAVERAPAWLLRPLPANAVADAALHAEIDRLAAGLPGSLAPLQTALDKVRPYREYDAAANRAAAHVWAARDRLYAAESEAVRVQFLRFAREHFVEAALARVCRRLVKDPAPGVRRQARKLVQRAAFRETALPLGPDGDWDASGWLRGAEGKPLSRHPQGRRVLERQGLPEVADGAALRRLLGVKSTKQLGFFLLASDQGDGPYTRFTIPKRDGSDRVICAPKRQLRWVQRRLLDEVLAKVPAHDAAHGFVAGRSVVTNAAPHRGAALLLKFDLTDFFPTIHYFRVVGLFASLGYTVGDSRFSAADDARNVAPTLARLCCYTPDPKQWRAVLPQGAPTSPAVSNLVCRRLDARLAGLAKRNKGVYTRYADDLTFSFRDPVGVDLGRFRWWVDQVCHQEGFFVNQKKFRVIRASQRQLVTGVVVNDELRVPREGRRRFRAILHNCRTHGVESQARGRPGFAAYLRGFASYLHMVQPEEGVERLREVEALLGPEPDGEPGEAP
jgi:hypothetical protein